MANRDHLPFQHIDVFPRILLICELLREVSGEDRSFHRVGITEACKRLLSKVDYFRGLNPGSFDGRGNYSLGLREQIIFPEIDYDSVNTIRGLDVAITTTAETDEQAEALLRGLGFPLATEEQTN